MRNGTRLAAILFTLMLAIACGGTTDQPSAQPGGSAASTEAPADAAKGTVATPGADMRAPAASTPAKPVMMEMDVPPGTELVLSLQTPVSSETAQAEQRVRATVAKPVVLSGMTIIPEGAPVTGTIVSAERSGRVKGRASIVMRFNEVTVANVPYKISTARIARQAEATKGEDAKKIAIGAGAGAAIGAIAGGKKGAAIGSAIGGGAGTGTVLATRGEEVTIPAGATLRTTIQETVRINAPMS
jgi:hypothetical protein